MIVLAIVCVITFAFSLAALSLSKSQQSQVLSKGWDSISPDTRSDIQKWGECCGFLNSTSIDNPSCSKLDCFKTGCPSCQDYLEADWFLHFRRSVGGVSLFVSILMCLSIYLTAKYRHIKNPRANANDYLWWIGAKFSWLGLTWQCWMLCQELIDAVMKYKTRNQLGRSTEELVFGKLNYAFIGMLTKDCTQY